MLHTKLNTTVLHIAKGFCLPLSFKGCVNEKIPLAPEWSEAQGVSRALRSMQAKQTSKHMFVYSI